MEPQELRFISYDSPVKRVFIFIVGIFPLISPYELLIKPRWTTFVSPFFIIALVISVGAIGIAVFFMLAAITGLNQDIRFDSLQQEMTYGFGSPVLRWRKMHIPFSEIADLQVRTVTRDGPDTYRLQVKTSDGSTITFGRFATKVDAEKSRMAIHQLPGVHFAA